MRTLVKNKQPIYYALYLGKTDVVDENGNITGSQTISYSNPQRVDVNVSASKGNSEVEPFGINETYTKTIVTDRMDCPIKEDSILWVGFGKLNVYVESSTYNLGDKVIYSDGVYECLGATTGAFDESLWKVIPYNYCVTRVAKSLNSILYAIKEVKTS